MGRILLNPVAMCVPSKEVTVVRVRWKGDIPILSLKQSWRNVECGGTRWFDVSVISAVLELGESISIALEVEGAGCGDGGAGGVSGSEDGYVFSGCGLFRFCLISHSSCLREETSSRRSFNSVRIEIAQVGVSLVGGAVVE